MAVRRTKCPSCGGFKIKVLSTDPSRGGAFNDSAKLQCDSCSHEWEGVISNENYRKLRRQGRVR